MSTFNSVTIFYMAGFIAFAQAGIGALLVNLKVNSGHRTWVIQQVLIGLGLVTLMAASDPQAASFPILAVFILLLGYFGRFLSLIDSFGKPLEKNTLYICVGAIVVVCGLYQWSYYLGSPLGSLETIVILPFLVISGFTTWYLNTLNKQKGSPTITWIDRVIGVEAVIYLGLFLGALAAVGQDYIQLESNVVLAVAIATLIIQLLVNQLWIIYSVNENPTGLNENMLAGKVKKSSPTKEISPGALKTSSSTKRAKKEDAKVNLSDDEKRQAFSELTDKELEVLRLVVQELKNKEIAEKLNISEASVKVHKSRMTSKLGMKSIPELSNYLNQMQSETTASDLPQENNQN